MGSHRQPGLFARLKARFSRQPVALDDYARARQLIDAIDRGGIPLNPAKVNAIARSFGLDVSRRAPVDETVERIRACLRRVDATHEH